MKSLFEYLIKFLKYLLVAGIVASLLFSIGSFIVNGYPRIFTPQETLVSANFTDFYQMTFKNDMDCKPGESYSSFELDFTSIPSAVLSDYKVNSANPIKFSISLPEGKLAINKHINGKSEYIDFRSIQSRSGYTGTISGLKVEFESDFVSITEDICAQEIKYEPDVGFLSILHDPNLYQWASTNQYMRSADKVRVIIEGPMNLNGFPGERIDKLELLIISNSDGQYLNIQTTAQGLDLELPRTGAILLDISDELSDTKKFQNSRLRAFPDELSIEVPVGILKLGNENSIRIGGLTKINEEKITFEKSTLSNYGYAVFGNIESAEYEVSGTTNGIVLNNDQLVKSLWDKTPDYIKSALVGALLAGIGGIWTFRKSIWNTTRLLVLVLNSSDPRKLIKGSFVCVTDTGMMIAGKLSRKPNKKYPFYLIKNARRKFNLSAEWEEEIIPEIKIRADAVEQSYIA